MLAFLVVIYLTATPGQFVTKDGRQEIVDGTVERKIPYASFSEAATDSFCDRQKANFKGLYKVTCVFYEQRLPVPPIVKPGDVMPQDWNTGVTHEIRRR